MKRLSAEDIIDLEVFIKNDESESEAFKEARDFRIYASAQDDDKSSELSLLKHWIEEMRKLSGKRSIGSIANGLFKTFAAGLFFAGLFLIGSPLANAFFVRAQGGIINVSYFFVSCIVVPFALFLSALFFAPILGSWLDMAVSALLKKFFNYAGGVRALYASNKKWILLKGAICAQYFGLGIACGIFLTQLSRPMFNEYEYGWRTTLPNYVTPNFVYKVTRVASLPWAIFAGSEVGYPSLNQVRDSLIKSMPVTTQSSANSKNQAASELANKPSNIATPDVAISAASNSADIANADTLTSAPRYETWAVFFILCSLFYGVVARAAVLVFLKIKINRAFGLHRIRNDRKINEILRRLTYSSLDSAANPMSSLMSDKNTTAVLLRNDMLSWRDFITSSVRESLAVGDAQVVEYAFGRELFGADIAKEIEDKKNLAFIYLADDYNEEVFENIENLVNRYPDKFISVHLLGKLSKSDAKFLPPLPVDKSWWERKINSISSRNIKLF